MISALDIIIVQLTVFAVGWLFSSGKSGNSFTKTWEYILNAHLIAMVQVSKQHNQIFKSVQQSLFNPHFS